MTGIKRRSARLRERQFILMTSSSKGIHMGAEREIVHPKAVTRDHAESFQAILGIF
jgi:hypothetical protein